MSFPISYEIIYSKRKSVAIQIRPDGQVIVRAPYGCPRSFINSFIHQKADWIVKHSAENKQRYEKQVQLKKDRPTLSDAQRKRYIETARSIFTQKAAYYARLIGVTYGRISIREQKTRWGSCSSKGNLNFNWRLIFAPEEVVDYIVVHELAHRKEMNHSRAFYGLQSPGKMAEREWGKIVELCINSCLLILGEIVNVFSPSPFPPRIRRG